MPSNHGKIKSGPNRWFRFHAESLDDPKVQRLAPHLFKTWVNLLSFACQNDGIIRREDVAFRLRMSDHDADAQVCELIGLGLLDIMPTGRLEPHNWRKRQFVSDSSTERVRKHRKSKEENACNVSETFTETAPEQSRAETETDSPKPPAGDLDGDSDPAMPKHVKPIASWSTAFEPASQPEHATVIRTEAGAIQLVNGTRTLWLEKFGGDAERLDLALIEIGGRLQPNGSRPLEAQVSSQLARIAADKRDRDRRYQSAAIANAAVKAQPKPVKLSRW